MSDNKNIELLIELNVSTKSSLKVFHGSTRDVDNLNVLKCNKSGVIVLERVEVSESYYEENIHYTNEFKGETHVQNGVILSTPLEDDIRRFESYKDLISNSEILDFGCGRGGFIKLTQEVSKRSVGLELNKINRKYINDIGVQCVNHLSELKDEKFDVITLNHVFEHLNDPINILKELQSHLKSNGVIIIEVPHARDLLLETFNLESFKNFTFWSDHLILHTKKSLESFTKNSGLQVRKIEGFQRYPISNHFNWLLKGQPSGHEIYKHLNNKVFHEQYENLLGDIDQNDTLIGYFGIN
jgi:2-polyprenyl-3-methyl-5-hydroxy-6-metoxy-1,4-benzoquinol methylase